MLDLAIEGLGSVRFPCSWVILFPAAALTVYARMRNAAVISAFIAAAAITAWLRFAGWWFAVPDGGGQIVIGILVGVVVVAAWRADSMIGDAGLGAVAALSAVSAWIPCVGPELGSLLNNARSAPWTNAPGTAAYIAGLLLPFAMVPAAVALAPVLDDRLRNRQLIGVGASLLLAFAALFVTTLLDDVASELARRSSY